MIATQAKIGAIGEKPTTELSWQFASMVNPGKRQFGLNSDGIHLLNSGDDDNGVSFTSSFTLATTDLGIKNLKIGTFLYIGIDCIQTEPISVDISFDEQAVKTYTAVLYKSGLQQIRIPIGDVLQGKYIKIKIRSANQFRIASVDGTFNVRPSGIDGY